MYRMNPGAREARRGLIHPLCAHVRSPRFQEMKAAYLRQHCQLGEAEVAVVRAVASGVLVPPGYSLGSRIWG